MRLTRRMYVEERRPPVLRRDHTFRNALRRTNKAAPCQCHTRMSTSPDDLRTRLPRCRMDDTDASAATPRAI